MKVLAVTNNPLVKEAEKTPDTLGCELRFVDGDAGELLVAVRDMVYEGYPLLTHPLAASIRVMYSPYRSVLLGSKTARLDPRHAEIAEDSLRKYRLATEHRIPDTANAEDYMRIDMRLLAAALQEPLPEAR